MEPGGGRSVQCLSVGMLDSAGIGGWVSVVLGLGVGRGLAGWDFSTKRTVLIGAMRRGDGLVGWVIGAVALWSDEVDWVEKRLRVLAYVWKIAGAGDFEDEQGI